MDVLANGIFLAAVNKKLVDYLMTPVIRKFPKADLWWVLYLALATGFVISWLSGANLFAEMIDNVILGRVLSGLLVGGGSSLIHDVFDRPEAGTVELTAGIEPGA